MSAKSKHLRRRQSRDWYQDRIHGRSEIGVYKGSILNISSRSRLDNIEDSDVQRMVDEMFRPLFG